LQGGERMKRWAEILWRLVRGIILLALSGTSAILAIFFQVNRQAWEWVRDHANPRAFGAGGEGLLRLLPGSLVPSKGGADGLPTGVGDISSDLSGGSRLVLLLIFFIIFLWQKKFLFPQPSLM
jgi:hypothetical protein